MARKFYDTSKFIPFPVAIIIAVVALIVLVFLGMQYASFDGSQLSAKVATSLGVKECTVKHDRCLEKAKKLFDECRDTVKSKLSRCLARAESEKDPVLRESLRAGCEIDSADDSVTCVKENTNYLEQCAVEARDCLEKYYEKKGVIPTFTPKPALPKPKAPIPGR